MSERPIENLLLHYRTIDASFGSLETLTRMRHELLLLRYVTIESRLVAVQTPLALSVATLVIALPVLFAVMPDDWRYSIWLWAIGVLTFVFIIKLVCDTVAAWRERKKIEALMPDDRGGRIEHKAWFKMMLISAHGTRLSIARSILADGGLTDKERAKFESVTKWWEELIQKEIDEAEQLHSTKYFTKDEFTKIIEWGKSAQH